MMDRDGDGTISPDDLLKLFKGNCIFDIEMAVKIITELDLNQDGKIQYSEFERFMRDDELSHNFTNHTHKCNHTPNRSKVDQYEIGFGPVGTVAEDNQGR